MVALPRDLDLMGVMQEAGQPIVPPERGRLGPRLIRLLRWRVWFSEKLRPSEWQALLLWAGIAGCIGGLASMLFVALAEGVHQILTGSRAGVVESMRVLPWWGVVMVPTFGAMLAGVVLQLGHKFTRAQSSTDYMEAIAIGSGRLSLRAALVKSVAALFSIGSGGSIGREGPMVQLAAVAASVVGRRWNFTAPQLRLLVACGAAAGIASAYNAPIAGSFFVAEIILGTIAMESLGPLAVAAVVATLTVRSLTTIGQLYKVPVFSFSSPYEMVPYVALGLVAGALAPMFLRTLRRSEKLFVALPIPLHLRLALGGLGVGIIAVWYPEVCGNGYSVVVQILSGELVWFALFFIFIYKWLATAFSFGSGAPGGVFTPSLFMGAAAGYLFGTGVHAVWPAGAVDPRAFALVGMGAFLSAATRAPVMAVILLFEMTLNYDIILPLLLSSVVAYYTARGIEEESLYSESLKRKEAEEPGRSLPAARVADLMKGAPPVVGAQDRFAAVAEKFLTVRVNNLYVVGEDGRFLGAVSLHDIKPYLGEPDLAELVLARDIMHEDFPRVSPDASIADALAGFLGLAAERLPVVDPGGRLLGSLAKGDVLLTLVEKRAKPAGTVAPFTGG